MVSANKLRQFPMRFSLDAVTYALFGARSPVVRNRRIETLPPHFTFIVLWRGYGCRCFFFRRWSTRASMTNSLTTNPNAEPPREVPKVLDTSLKVVFCAG